MKNFNYSLIAAALLTGTVVLSSCSSDELPVGNEVQVVNGAAKAYSFSIPAVMDDEADTRVFEIGESTIKSSFSTSEKVYVYLKRGDVIAYGNLPLTPSNVSPDGQSCTLDTPKDFYFISETPNFAPEVDDEVYLYYGMDPNYALGIDTYYSFRTYGTKEDVEKKDFCLAEMVVTGVDNKKLTFGQKKDPTKTNFSFTNINSVFRQKVTFKNEKGEVVTPKIKEFTISTSYFFGHSKTLVIFNPIYPEHNRYGHIKIIDTALTDGNIYFSMLFNDNNKESELIFLAVDEDGVEYEARKSATGGLENNKYYYGDVELKRIVGDTNPTLTGNTQETSGYLEMFTNSNATFSGRIIDKYYPFMRGANYNITLDNMYAVSKDNYPLMFLNAIVMGESKAGTITLNLKGDNYILTKDDYAIRIDNGEECSLKLKCEGEEARLTICSNDYRSFEGFENIDAMQSLSSGYPLGADVLKDMAAEGYTVERSAVIYDDIEGKTYWTFTVKKDNSTPLSNITGIKDYEASNPNEDGVINYIIKDNPADITISGDSDQQTFVLLYGGTVTLDNLKSNVYDRLPWDYAETQSFVTVAIGAPNDLTLNLNGDNEVFMSNGYPNFYSDGGNLQLKCEGDQATLSLITNIQGDPGSGIQNYAGFAGFYNADFTSSGMNNSFGPIQSESDPGYEELQKLAADDDGDGKPDYIITRSAATAQQQMFYKWTYTITKIKP